MAWANLSVFAFGSLLVGIPVLLHLLMKKRPRHQIFPAMRFLRTRQVANKRQMRLRNWLLLVLRMAAIALLAAIFARPSVDSIGMGYWLRALLLGVLAPLAIVAFIYSWLERKSRLLVGSTGLVSLLLCIGLAYFAFQAFATRNTQNLGAADDPVAAVLVFDTSPRMGLRHQNLNRLEEARVMARELMKQLPVDSEVAVIDGASSGTFSVDLGAATTMVDSLQVLGLEYPLSDLVLRGIELASARSDKRKEVYVFSDMSENVWQESAFRPIRNRLETLEDVSLFVLDVGVSTPRNVRLGPLRLSSESLAKGQPLRIKTDVVSLNMDGEFDVQISLEEPDPTRPVLIDGKLMLPELTPRERISQSIAADSEAEVTFSLPALPSGIHHGQVIVKANDGLRVDDTRYFTIEVRPPFPVLLATSKDADPQNVKQAISPDEFERRGISEFDCHLVDAQKLLGQQLDDYSIVSLLDPSPLTKPHWSELERYVRNGGALVIFLGRNAQPVAEFNDTAKALMPGDLKRYWRTAAGDDLFFSPKNTASPILSPFRNRESTIEWDKSPIFLHWVLGDLKSGSSVVAAYSNNQPAIIESAIGKGRVVVMTTPVSDKRKVSQSWNDFPTADEPLPFFMLMQGLYPYLARQSQQPLNHTVGQLVTLSTQDAVSGTAVNAWQLVTPQGDWQNVRGEEGRVSIASTEHVGAYRLKPADPNELGIGFSANLPTQATDIKRLPQNRLDEIIGKDKYTLARGSKELSRGIGRARVGRELFPFLMLVVVGLLAMEHLLSNRFYSTQTTEKTDKKLRSAA